MKKIKETITALAGGDFPSGVRVSRTERKPMSDERLRLVLNRLTAIATILAVAILVVNVPPIKLVTLAGAMLLAMVLWCMR